MKLRTKYPVIDIAGATVAITGGARGIGRATAKRFADKGATVVIGDLDVEAAEITAKMLGPAVSALTLDVTRPESFAKFFTRIDETSGPVDILVNNAGIMPIDRFLNTSDELAAATLNVNVWGPINGMRLVLPGMTERRRGHIVNVASLTGKTHLPGLSIYCASKFAMVGLTAAVRSEVAEYGVSVSAILPSMVRTELASGVPDLGPAAVEPETVAEAIVESVRTRRAETAVPRWVGAAATATNLLPAGVAEAVRKILRDDRGLVANQHPARAEYLARIGKQTNAYGQQL